MISAEPGSRNYYLGIYLPSGIRTARVKGSGGKHCFAGESVDMDSSIASVNLHLEDMTCKRALHG